MNLALTQNNVQMRCFGIGSVGIVIVYACIFLCGPVDADGSVGWVFEHKERKKETPRAGTGDSVGCEADFAVIDAQLR